MGTSRELLLAFSLLLLLAADCSKHPSGTSAMTADSAKSPSGDNPAPAVAVFDRALGLEYFVVGGVGPGNDLVTRRFFCSLPEYGPSARERADWGVPVPASARLFAATAGMDLSEAGTAWVGWVEPSAVQVVSALVVHPATITTPPGALVALPPVTVASKRLHLFVFEPTEGGGAALVRHQATGPLNTPITVTRDRVATIATMPVMAAGAAVADVFDRDVAIVGWVEVRDAASRITVAIDEGTAGVKTASAFDIAGVRPIGGRLNVEMTPTSDPETPLANRPAKVRVAFVGELLEGHRYAAVTAEIVVKTGDFTLHTEPLPLDPLPRAVGGYVVFRHRQDLETTSFLLREDGTLHAWNTGSDGVAFRRNVPLDYGFPLVWGGSMEPRTKNGGDVDLVEVRYDGAIDVSAP